jgi:hypothetical protein
VSVKYKCCGLRPQVIPGIHFRHNKFNMIGNLAFKRIYVPTHTNMGCYLVGIWAGLKMHKMEAPTRTLSHKINFYLVTILGNIVIMSGYIFYVYDFEKPSLWSALYAGLQKIIFGWGLVYLMWCLSHKLESEWAARMEFGCNCNL